jgi:hypothetical protein
MKMAAILSTNGAAKLGAPSTASVVVAPDTERRALTSASAWRSSDPYRHFGNSPVVKFFEILPR